MKMLDSFRRMPIHWRVLFAGQGIITVFIVYRRLETIQKTKETKLLQQKENKIQ